MSTADSVAVATPPTGAQLRDEFGEAVRAFTFGLVRLRGNSLVLGREVELLRFGSPSVTGNGVEWPIEGGLLSARRGGTWRIRATDGRVEAKLSGWTPSLPRPLYDLTQLQVHLLFTRVYLLRLRGGVAPVPGKRASRQERLQAAAVDAAFCFMLAGFTGRRRPSRVLAVAAVYHVVSWSTSGRTLGGLVMRQRVVAIDGSRLTPTQALLRLALTPASWILSRPLHDELAASDVVSD